MLQREFIAVANFELVLLLKLLKKVRNSYHNNPEPVVPSSNCFCCPANSPEAKDFICYQKERERETTNPQIKKLDPADYRISDKSSNHLGSFPILDGLVGKPYMLSYVSSFGGHIN